MRSKDLAKFNLSDAPGVYFFKRGKNILYIGKATSIKDRVRSYFVHDILLTRSPLIARMLNEADKVEFIETDSVLEALILEVERIKKHQPVYNSKEKDDKSYNFITVTKEDFPKVLVTRGAGTYGPFPYGGELKEALKIVRKIFPFRDDKCLPRQGGIKPCFNAQIGLCPGSCAGWISKKDYQKIIKHIKLFFEANKPKLVKSLEEEMKALAKGQKFEEAEKVKRQLFALSHIQDIALIRKDVENDSTRGSVFRIEAYDVAHISGTNVVGVMTVVEDRELAKSQYRKFKLKLNKNNDTKNLKEILTRRLNHEEWRMPNIIVVDGGVGQINVAKEVLKEKNLNIQIVSVVKDERHKAREIMGLKDKTLEKSILLSNLEAHRFAINYHRLLRSKGFRI